MAATDKSQTAVPKLRFPEFSGAWASAPMQSLYEFKPTNNLSRDKLNYECGEVRNIHYGDIHTKYSARFILDNENVPYINDGAAPSRLDPDDCCAVGDMVFADASEDLDDVGKSIEIVNLNDERVLAGMHTILARRSGDDLVVGFGAYLFGSAAVRNQIKHESQGAKVFGISPKRLGDTLLLYPDRHKEQQKIADCLSSLDDSIAAETRKLDVLKTHKRGLLQQLFPTEGQRLPRLRFPGFRGVTGWRPRPLDAFIDEFRQKSTTQDEYEVLTSARDGLVKQRDYYDNDRITGRNNIGFNVIPQGYLTYRSRSDDRNFYFNENELGITGIISTYYPVFCIKGGSNKFFIELLTHYSDIVGRHSVGTSQTVLSLNSLRRIVLPIPEADEQQRIARCLSSLDNLIAAQSGGLAALRQHKKGLMKGLFPAMDAHAA